MLKNGKYQHYKGKMYEVLGVALHSETLEELVVYRQLYGEFGLWVRPLTMFVEKVNCNGQLRDRYNLTVFIKAVLIMEVPSGKH